MTLALVRKLLRDVRLGLAVTALLLGAFQCLWAKVTERIVTEILTEFQSKGMPPAIIKSILFKDTGKITQVLMGGEGIEIDRVADMLSIGYVHPLVLAIFCIWAIGRSSGAIAGEIDRGTMELLMAQPLARFRVILAHLCVDLVTIPVPCLSLWAGTWLGVWLFGLLHLGAPIDSQGMRVDPRHFGWCLFNVAAFLFAVSGYTIWLSSMSRFRNRVLGIAVLITLVQFVVNLLGQLWGALAPLRPLTVFYYYQPQRILLKNDWTVKPGELWGVQSVLPPIPMLTVLIGVGALGYVLAWWTFSRRDLPAPL